MFAASPKDYYFRCIIVPVSQKSLEVQYMLNVLTPAMFAYSSTKFGSNTKRLKTLFCETCITEFTIMLFACYVEAAEY